MAYSRSSSELGLEAWLNALIFMMPSEKEVPPEIIILTINQAIFIFGEQFFNELYDNLILIQKYDKSKADKIIAATRELHLKTKIIYDQDAEFLYRLL